MVLMIIRAALLLRTCAPGAALSTLIVVAGRLLSPTWTTISPFGLAARLLVWVQLSGTVTEHCPISSVPASARQATASAHRPVRDQAVSLGPDTLNHSAKAGCAEISLRNPAPSLWRHANRSGRVWRELGKGRRAWRNRQDDGRQGQPRSRSKAAHDSASFTHECHLPAGGPLLFNSFSCGPV